MKEFKKNIKFVWQYSKGEKKNILKYLSLNLFDIVASIFFPIISAQIIVNLTDNNIKQFLYIGCVLLIAHLIESTISHFKSKLYEKTLRETYINIQTSLGAEILKLNNKILFIQKTRHFAEFYNVFYILFDCFCSFYSSSAFLIDRPIRFFARSMLITFTFTI